MAVPAIPATTALEHQIKLQSTLKRGLPGKQTARRSVYGLSVSRTSFTDVAWWLSGWGVGFGTERSRVRLPAAAFPGNKVNSAFHPSGVGKSSTCLHGLG